jgi:Leucine Rich Repeat.
MKCVSCRLIKLGSDLKRFQNVFQILHLGSTNLTSLPDTMFTGMKVETLYLNGNKLTQVPNLTPLSESLLNLNLDNNQIGELNKNSFPNLKYLTNLNISANSELYAIRKNTFKNLLNLQTLYCNFNPKLTFIHPYSFNNDWSLKEVRVVLRTSRKKLDFPFGNDSDGARNTEVMNQFQISVDRLVKK